MAEPRIDYFDSYDPTTVFQDTPEGFLQGDAIVTNIGVFQYLNPDGSIRRELRLPEEVFHPDSLDSLKGKPLTNNHPTVAVDSMNYKDFTIGSCGTNVKTTAYHVAVGLTVMDAQAVADIKAKKKVQLSCGYTCDMELAPPNSMYLGMPYDYIQRNIRYNHVSLVDRARAGNDARIRVDSAVGLPITTEEGTQMPDMKTVNLDGIDYQAEVKVLEVLHKTRNDHAEAVKTVEAQKVEISKISAERDNHKDQLDAVSKELADLKAKHLDASAIDKLVAEKVSLISKAKELGVEKTDGLTDRQIKEAAVKVKFPAVNFDGKDDVYVQARFDALVEDSVQEGQDDQKQKEVGAGQPSHSDSAEPKADDARQRYLKSLSAQHVKMGKE